MGFLTELRSRGTAADYHALVERMPYARLLGLSIDSIDEQGRLLTKLRFDRAIVGNPNLPAIHGGVIGAFLEMAAIFQLVREGEGDRLPKPINFTVEYLRSAGPRDSFARRRQLLLASGRRATGSGSPRGRQARSARDAARSREATRRRRATRRAPRSGRSADRSATPAPAALGAADRGSRLRSRLHLAVENAAAAISCRRVSAQR